MAKKESLAARRIPVRVLLYLVGAVVLGFGIVLCVKCEMGVSPINSVPYVASHLVPLSLGALSIVFYLVNIAAQLILSDRKAYVGILLQLPVSFLFGAVIDLWDVLLPSAGTMFLRLVCLCGSLIFTAIGILLIVTADLVPDPPTGAVQVISQVTKKKLGNVKVVYDSSCVVLGLFLSLFCLHQIIGFGVATIASAVFVGKILAFLQKTFPAPQWRKTGRRGE